MSLVCHVTEAGPGWLTAEIWEDVSHWTLSPVLAGGNHLDCPLSLLIYFSCSALDGAKINYLEFKDYSVYFPCAILKAILEKSY